jgi:adenine deaminase
MKRGATWSRQPLAELTRLLMAVCMGREPADLVITGGRLVNVHTREVLNHVDVAVKHGRVAMLGYARHSVGSETETIDADGAYLVPGLVGGVTFTLVPPLAE